MGKKTNRVDYLKKEVNKYRWLILVQFVLWVLYLIACLFLVISFWINWASNDSFTFIQICKWQFHKYWWLFVFIIVEDINYRWKFKNDAVCYKSLKKQLETEKDKEESAT